MATATNIKKRFIDHVNKIDLEKLSLYELSTYADLVEKIEKMEKPDFVESLTKMGSIGFGFGSAPAKTKEVE